MEMLIFMMVLMEALKKTRDEVRLWCSSVCVWKWTATDGLEEEAPFKLDVRVSWKVGLGMLPRTPECPPLVPSPSIPPHYTTSKIGHAWRSPCVDCLDNHHSKCACILGMISFARLRKGIHTCAGSCSTAARKWSENVGCIWRPCLKSPSRI